jgi:ribosomal-protein-alanine N-acetyltransferase
MDEYREHGYAAEAVDAATACSLKQPSVARVEAETEPDDRAFQRVLRNAAFFPPARPGKKGRGFICVSI